MLLFLYCVSLRIKQNKKKGATTQTKKGSQKRSKTKKGVGSKQKEMASNPMLSRLQKEMDRMLKAIGGDPSIGVGAWPISETDLTKWRAIIIGPADTPFEGGWFALDITCPPNYPFSPPQIRFSHRVFHPNVYPTNHICLDILQSHWSPNYTIATTLISIRSLLNDPNIDSPANVDASKAYRNADKTEYNRQVRATMLQTGHVDAALPEWYNELFVSASAFSPSSVTAAASSTAGGGAAKMQVD